ncbi:MAG: leucine--tRNA ligase, partial [Dehalococcoidia bacterium]|nr:leucine--tRNA ligase [Dehalococcoidia bacterium]
IAALMEMSNALEDVPAGTPQWQAAFDRLLLLLAPLAPHIAEELWSRRGQPYSIHRQPWPSFDPALTVEVQVTLVVQVNGRVRDKLTVEPDITQERAQELALASERVRQHTGGRAPQKVIYVPGKLINLVV